MTNKRQLGAILLESGRITQGDVDRVLAYQRVHGGFFGQAVVALGILTRSEVDYFLSSQLDLPYIFPNAAAVDRDAAHLVTAEWALKNLAVPILRAGNYLTVVAPEPLSDSQIRELSAATGCEVDLALASAQRIRELIHALFGESVATEPPVPALSFQEFVAEALDSGTARFGVSVRGGAATAWYLGNQMERRSLSEGWDVLFNDALYPGPGVMIDLNRPGLLHWNASLHRASASIAVLVKALVGNGGVEYLIEPVVVPTARISTRDVMMPATISTELRLLAQGGSARVGLVGDDDEFLRALLPQLPRLAFHSSARAVHITDQKNPPGGVYALITEDGSELVDTLAAYDFDVLTLDLKPGTGATASLLAAAPLSLVLIPGTDTAELGLGWILRIARAPDHSLTWDLAPAAG